MHRSTSRFVRGLTLAAAFTAAGAGPALAAGTITVDAGAARTADQTDAAYAAPLAGVAFERAAWASDPAAATWSPLCTTGASGSCTAAVSGDGRYLVREAGAPAGYRSFTELAWGGASSGASPLRSYVGDVTVAGDDVTVHPSTAWAPTAPNAGSGPFVLARDNPVLPDRCALDVLLLLDRSGSIAPSADAYESAAQDFVDTLAGTPVRLKIASFAVAASLDQGAFLDLDEPADVAAAKATISAVYAAPGGGTNWDGGLALAATTGVDLVTLVTDGNPTTHRADGSAAPGTSVGLLDLTAGIASANLVKTEGKAPGVGATLRAVGVGDVTSSNLAAISGPVEGRDWSASGVAQLRAELQALANRLCGARIHVRKLTDAPDPAEPKAGWTIRASSPDAVATPASLETTGGTGDVFELDRVPGSGAAVEVAETQQPGFSLVGAGCRQGGFAEPAAGGSTAIRVQRGDDWYCTFRNVRVRSGVSIEKSGPAVVRHGDTASFSFAVRNTGNVPLRDVRVGDDRCPGVSTAPTGDDGNGTLDPAEVWTFTCSYVVGPHADGEEDPIRNVATVSAVDVLDQPVTATDSHETRIEHPAPPVAAPPVAAPPAPAPVLGTSSRPVDGSGSLNANRVRVRGTARLRGTTGCAAKTARATVTGRRIRSVTWSVDGKARRSPAKPGAGGRWTLVVDMQGMRVGAHRVQARVRFVAGSGTAARQLVLEVSRCKVKAVRAAFTG